MYIERTNVFNDQYRNKRNVQLLKKKTSIRKGRDNTIYVKIYSYTTN